MIVLVLVAALSGCGVWPFGGPRESGRDILPTGQAGHVDSADGSVRISAPAQAHPVTVTITRPARPSPGAVGVPAALGRAFGRVIDVKVDREPKNAKIRVRPDLDAAAKVAGHPVDIDSVYLAVYTPGIGWTPLPTTAAPAAAASSGSGAGSGGAFVAAYSPHYSLVQTVWAQAGQTAGEVASGIGDAASGAASAISGAVGDALDAASAAAHLSVSAARYARAFAAQLLADAPSLPVNQVLQVSTQAAALMGTVLGTTATAQMSLNDAVAKETLDSLYPPQKPATCDHPAPGWVFTSNAAGGPLSACMDRTNDGLVLRVHNDSLVPWKIKAPAEVNLTHEEGDSEEWGDRFAAWSDRNAHDVAIPPHGVASMPWPNSDDRIITEPAEPDAGALANFVVTKIPSLIPEGPYGGMKSEFQAMSAGLEQAIRDVPADAPATKEALEQELRGEKVKHALADATASNRQIVVSDLDAVGRAAVTFGDLAFCLLDAAFAVTDVHSAQDAFTAVAKAVIACGRSVIDAALKHVKVLNPLENSQGLMLAVITTMVPTAIRLLATAYRLWTQNDFFFTPMRVTVVGPNAAHSAMPPATYFNDVGAGHPSPDTAMSPQQLSTWVPDAFYQCADPALRQALATSPHTTEEFPTVYPNGSARVTVWPVLEDEPSLAAALNTCLPSRLGYDATTGARCKPEGQAAAWIGGRCDVALRGGVIDQQEQLAVFNPAKGLIWLDIDALMDPNAPNPPGINFWYDGGGWGDLPWLAKQAADGTWQRQDAAPPTGWTDATACATLDHGEIEARAHDLWKDPAAINALIASYAGAPAFQKAIKETAASYVSTDGQGEGDAFSSACGFR